ncbi:MAG: response regulator [Gammaproteobacteria bacterium]|nr:response regulator [Gammaproteobacteria bacterium]
MTNNSALVIREVAHRRKILFVDDELNIINSLKRCFRGVGYEIHSATSAREALEILKLHEIGVVLSDQRMPQMTGVEFLSQVKELYPETIRIVLSGYTELDSITDAINKGSVYKFLTKPWDDDLLKRRVEEAFQAYEMSREKDRLGKELADVNMELKAYNKQLRRLADEKTVEAMRSVYALSLSQEILEALPTGIISVDSLGFVSMANEGLLSMFDLQQYRLPGMSMENIPGHLKSLVKKMFSMEELDKKFRVRDRIYRVRVNSFGEKDDVGKIFMIDVESGITSDVREIG